MRTSELKANLATPVTTATETDAGIIRLATTEEILSGTDLPIAVSPQPDLLLTGFRNVLCNGTFSIGQRGTSFDNTNNLYFSDRWRAGYNGTGLFNFTRESTDGPLGLSTEYYQRLEVSTADPTIDAGHYNDIYQKVEGFNIIPFLDKPFCLSFWVRSSIVGTFCVAIRNAAITYCSVNEVTINQANTWEKKVVIFPSIPSAYVSSFSFINATGIILFFTLACGTNYQTSTLGQWVSGNYISTPNQTNFTATLGTTFDIAYAQLEANYGPTPFEILPQSVENDRCLRYFEGNIWLLCIRFGSFGSYNGSQPFIHKLYHKRSTPSVSFWTDSTRATAGLIYNGTTLITSGWSTAISNDIIWVWGGTSLPDVGDYINGFVDISSEL